MSNRLNHFSKSQSIRTIAFSSNILHSFVRSFFFRYLCLCFAATLSYLFTCLNWNETRMIIKPTKTTISAATIIRNKKETRERERERERKN